MGHDPLPGSSTTAGPALPRTGFDSWTIVGFGVALDGDLGSHAAHGVDTAPVTGLDQQLDVRPEEVPVHGDGGAVGKRQVLAIAELLDEAEDVIPTAAVQACGVVL